ncbi:YaeQ family protein [Ectothiorhodospiraceae bacterium 2226]|nr:YaeQ family protein [Ectothiorhodospiraceae bacterium 2226]
MALSATTYKVELDLSDLDRGVFEAPRFTLARHPSETVERLVVRILAYALWYEPQLAFGRDLSDNTEPALVHVGLDGRLLHGIEVGQPDAERLVRSARRAERLSLLAYGNVRVWASRTLPLLEGVSNLAVAAVEADALADLARDLPRNLRWGVMISENSLFVTDARGQHEVPLEWLRGQRRAD